ncbi:hypothetical protein Nepgr_004315 [Nepenthes gracilis]|uniref:Uncharacterized protein n=1 Tax=Nepenthes gracilis TaxID=150966 RepID=A0AAD3XF65_NEPGR|nr:hypothetical protein Nepgr_004315 [Nepenthes gracilis]
MVGRPPEVSAAEAAGFPIAACTAYGSLTRVAGLMLSENGKTKTILVTAGSSGVGHYAVQLAELGNMHVTATCMACNLDFIKGLGVDKVLDYRVLSGAPTYGAALRSPSGKKYDFMLHCTSGIPWSTFCLESKVIDLTPSPRAMWFFAVKKVTPSKKQLVPYVETTEADNLEFLVKLVQEGKLKAVVRI